jgi:hypothetical protein
VTRDLLEQIVTNDTALWLNASDGSKHIWYPRGFVRRPFKEVMAWLESAMRKGIVIYTGNPDRWADLCSVTFLNAAAVVSFQKAGGNP